VESVEQGDISRATFSMSMLNSPLLERLSNPVTPMAGLDFELDPYGAGRKLHEPGRSRGAKLG
jgi:hypothetical protein